MWLLSATGVIIAAVAEGVLLIVVVVSVSVYLGRRKRQAAFHNQHQLFTDEDDDATVILQTQTLPVWADLTTIKIISVFFFNS